MGYGTNGLSFNTLRDANSARLPEFRNRHGGIAHSKHDGSDWSPAQWLQATLGELGEWARARLDYECGRLSFAEYAAMSSKELADVVIYLDILARRSLDQLTPHEVDGRSVQGSPFEDCPSRVLMKVVALLGSYANTRKKFERGDYSAEEYIERKLCVLPCLTRQMGRLIEAEDDMPRPSHPGDVVVNVHPTGVNLGLATVDKFNEVSERVGSAVRIGADDWHLFKPTR